MTQSAAAVPVHNPQRKAAIAHGGVRDHSGAVRVDAIPDFELDRTIFNTLEGGLARFVIRTRIAKEVHWAEPARAEVEQAYAAAQTPRPLPEVDPALLQFLVDECDFDVEHADGSFLDHLYFCYEYTHRHYPEHSALVMLLHSILGTGTNTFAMEAGKMPALQALITDFEWRHVAAFPSVLRLLYDQPLRQELWEKKDRLEELEAIHFHRVIDNERLTMTAEDFWIHLNYHLIHQTDFLPVSNWWAHANDTAFIVFRDLYAFLKQTGRLATALSYEPASKSPTQGEAQTLGAKLVDWIPVSVSEKMAGRSIRRFSARIGHSMDYEIVWRS